MPNPDARFVPCAPEAVKTRSSKWRIDRVVIHTAEGTLSGTVAWFQRTAAQRGTSYAAATHYVLGRSGELVQMAEESARLIHCGSKSQPGWNDRSIGIELEAWSGQAKPPASIKFPVNDFPEVQLQALAKLVKGICLRHGIPLDRTHIVGHGEIPGQDHTDPGASFPWDRFLSLCLWA